jgi:hypothetical protein
LKLSPPSVLAHRALQRSLDRISSRVPEAVHKLWFIQRTLLAFESLPAALRRVPVLRNFVFHYVALESMGELAFGPRRAPVSVPRAALWCFYRGRVVFFTLLGATLLFGLFRTGVYGYTLARSGTDWVFDQIAAPAEPSAALQPSFASAERSGPPPTSVWLVARDGEEELWSNGLRVVTSFEVEGPPRSFFAFPRDGSPPVPMHSRPVGIVYHASESDMAPFAPEFSQNILATTRDLIGWLSRRRIYHYVIDRFGLVYRVVSDETVAVHAGVSIWGDGDYYYLNLNESFIGIAFESRWSAASQDEDVITTAQLQAAMNLTDLLRSRYDISDINCVPHGLVSVNAGKRLIGYHADWARDFPFAALGLSDKYQLPPPSVSAFGFSYDEDLVARLGGSLWPGVVVAERELERRAAAEGVPLPTLRSRLHRRYVENVEVSRLSPSTSARPVRPEAPEGPSRFADP